MRATSETLAPGSSDAATSRSFSSCDHRRRRSTDVITSALEIVIALLLGLPLGPAAFASVKQGGPQRRSTRRTRFSQLLGRPLLRTELHLDRDAVTPIGDMMASGSTSTANRSCLAADDHS